MRKLVEVILWSNGMIMVFGYEDHQVGVPKQITELQGPFNEERKAAILAAADAETMFEHGSWLGKNLCPVAREDWGKKGVGIS